MQTSNHKQDIEDWQFSNGVVTLSLLSLLKRIQLNPEGIKSLYGSAKEFIYSWLAKVTGLVEANWDKRLEGMLRAKLSKQIYEDYRLNLFTINAIQLAHLMVWVHYDTNRAKRMLNSLAKTTES